MVARSIRERIAVALLAGSVVVASVLGVMTVLSFTQGGTSGFTGQVSGAQAPSSGTSSGGGSTGSTATAGGTGSSSQSQSGVSGGSITIGGFFDISGPVDSSVERDTVRAYFAKINDAGGINGRKLVLLPCDGYYDEVHSHQCALTMVDNHVLAMVGDTFPGGENDQVPFLNKEGIPTIGGLGVPHEYDNALSYPVSPSFAFSGNALAAQIKQVQQTSPFYRKPAILYISDVDWVQPVIKAVETSLKAIGVTPTHVEGASATNDPDYTQHVANLISKDDGDPPNGVSPAACSNKESPAQNACPDSLIAATDPFSYTKLFQAMDRVGWHPPIVAGGLDKGNVQSLYSDQLGCGACGETSNNTSSPTDRSRQAMSSTPFVSPLDPAQANNPTVKDYLDSMNKYFPSQVPALDVYTQIAWTSAQVFVEALKEAGSNVTRESLVAALNKMQNFDTGWSTKISYSPGGGHDPNHCYYFIRHDPKSFDQGGTWRQYTGLQCL